MRPYLAVSLLLWFLLLSEAQGIRLDRKYYLIMSQGQQKVHHEDGSDLMKKTNGGTAGDQVMILCKDGHCSSGKNRKLITTTTSTTTTTSKNEKSGQDYYYKKADPMSKGQSGSGEHGEKETFMLSGKPTSDEHRDQTAHEHFPDNTDIVDMDYSPAKRKPPIHN